MMIRNSDVLKSLFPDASSLDDVKSKSIVYNSIIDTNNFGCVDIKDGVWSSGPQDNRSWLWSLHSYSLFDCLIACKYEGYVNELVSSWAVLFENRPVDDDFPWHDHATALRLERLARMALVFDKFKFYDLVKSHADLLLRKDFYSENTNHGFDQAMSLLVASLVFEGMEGYLLWRKTGLQRLKQEINFAFTEEGIHVENSPAYHVGMTNNLIRARKVLSLLGDAGAYLDSIFKGALWFLAWITRPDRFVALLGDSASYRPNVSSALSSFEQFEFIKWVLSAGKEGRHPDMTSIIFEKSGYAVYRSDWKDWVNHTHIVFKSGFLSKYHRQDDDLNILVYAYGEDWLIDSGMYNHNQSDPVRLYMRSALAHNIPYVPDSRVNRSSPSSSFSYLRPSSAPGYAFAVDGFTKMYSGGRIRRRLLVRDAGYFRIHDKFLGYDGQSKYCIFHFPKDKSIVSSFGKAVVKGRNANLIIRCSDKKISCNVFSGKCDVFSSLTSKIFNVVEDSQAVVFGPSFDSDLVFSFDFKERL
ncbi:heparinase II/III family protein [Alcaligenes faecalis]|uniref:heparinase II/III family protein n=1 Tax=Alcaligenes faecalis TaxID=511 RepID=UPI0006C58679|nr:heparinase II/III family protein [Alcaligenes faecalis]ATI01098.1 hypothetical protein CPY64_15865 [Alcaligenes faecalis]AYZ90456.1 hypothetical protein EGY22_02750 [Alcaligenes faecalis]MCX5595073.1 heparinase II/III family protein [Alcaligenes faecalis]QQC33724.1 heparinase II/III family protein [Alcaligenes faecalis]CAJ0910233.1 Hepar_II_III_N domain-containing protein [Alcaligenes faecalis subsp. faecalis]